MSTDLQLDENENEKLAEELFMSLCAGAEITLDTNKLNKLKINILNENGYTEFRPTLFCIIELCQSKKTSLQRELLAKAYSWLGAEYRKKAIECINLYLNMDMKICEREPYPLFKDGKEVWIMEKSAQKCMMMLLDLSKAYEGEYMFDMAYQTLERAWHLFPYSYTVLAYKFKLLRKMNRLSDIIDIINKELLEDWTEPFYYEDITGKRTYYEEIRKSLLRNRDEYQKLIDKNYVYRPRPRKK